MPVEAPAGAVPARKPDDEEERLAALRAYEILDTLPEPGYDDLTLLASRICGTPIALVSLVDGDRQWFKSKVGLDASETPRDVAFCAHAILAETPLIVSDTREDARFSGNPLVLNDPKIRFYAGAPLRTPAGQNVGTLCVIDRSPRTLTQGQREALEALARQVVGQMELRRKIGELEESGRALLDAKAASDEASRVKSRFLAHMSHELRTPLNAIIGFSNQLFKTMPEDGVSKQKKYLERILVNGKHLLGLIDDVLDLSRLNAGRMTVHVEPVEAGGLIRELADRVEPLAAARDNRLIATDGTGNATLRTDRTKLEQCLLNLVSNACKFTERGEIRISAERDGSENGTGFRFEVSDTGRGMTAEQIARLFSEYSQVSDPEPAEGKGTGLGLAITRGLCRLLGGGITVRSEPGRGTTFTIRLPASLPPSTHTA